MKFIRLLKQEAAALWVLGLVLLAGALNTAGFLQFGQTLSHMTGNLTKLGLSLAGRVQDPVFYFVLFLLGFLLGATLSGFAFPRHSLHQWRRCGLVLTVCGLLLILAQLLHLPSWLQMLLAAFVLGSQNGLAMRYHGILTRTTHVTGHITDVGASLGRMIQARSWKGDDLRAFLFHTSVLLAFLLGVTLVALLYPLLADQNFLTTMALCGIGYTLFGLGTLVFMLAKRRK